MSNTKNKIKVGVVTAQIKWFGRAQHDSEAKEFKLLALTLGYEVAAEFSQKLDRPHSNTYLSKGKVLEIKQASEDMKLDKILISSDISPSQSKSLESAFKIPVIDRSGLVLEIFEKHASTNQAKTQVALAKLNYQLPRLTGLWTHLDRERGGSNVSKGMGERQINVDRSLLRKRITTLNDRLAKIATRHEVQTKQQKSKLNICLAGYTNVGKSSIMKEITGVNVKAQDDLFTTLSTTTRQMLSKFKPDILVSDTVGFIRDLPPDLIKAFRTTLASLLSADLIIHVCDFSDPNWEYKLRSAYQIFTDIGADGIPELLVFNKMDKVSTANKFYLQKSYPNAILVTTHAKEDMKALRLKIESLFQKTFIRKKLSIRQDNSSYIQYLYRNAVIDQIKYCPKTIKVSASMSSEGWKKFDKHFACIDC
ncbi:MAG: GTPase HflX [SAR324 cluster bacterium]|nr:GTPase HflX [SAR324 cluster bacterium]